MHTCMHTQRPLSFSFTFPPSLSPSLPPGNGGSWWHNLSHTTEGIWWGSHEHPGGVGGGKEGDWDADSRVFPGQNTGNLHAVSILQNSIYLKWRMKNVASKVFQRLELDGNYRQECCIYNEEKITTQIKQMNVTIISDLHACCHLLCYLHTWIMYDRSARC